MVPLGARFGLWEVRRLAFAALLPFLPAPAELLGAKLRKEEELLYCGGSVS